MPTLSVSNGTYYSSLTRICTDGAWWESCIARQSVGDPWWLGNTSWKFPFGCSKLRRSEAITRRFFNDALHSRLLSAAVLSLTNFPRFLIFLTLTMHQTILFKLEFSCLNILILLTFSTFFNNLFWNFLNYYNQKYIFFLINWDLQYSQQRIGNICDFFSVQVFGDSKIMAFRKKIVKLSSSDQITIWWFYTHWYKGHTFNLRVAEISISSTFASPPLIDS